MKSASFLSLLTSLLLTSLGFASQAQTRVPAPDSLRRRGELTGARPSGKSSARVRQAAGTRTASADAAVQQHLLNADVNLAQTSADQLPDLYDHFISTTREERRRWRSQDWAAAGQVLARLNQRYEALRTDLSLEERVRIRSFQGEFHTLRGARQVKESLD